MKWLVSRNHSLSVHGEYESLNSWSGERRISDTLTYRIDIIGKRKANSYGLKPVRWSARLRYNGYSFSVPSSHTSCKSIGDACRLADKALTEAVFRDTCQFFLSRKFAHCIADKNLNPYFTSFGHPQWFDNFFFNPKRNFPCGTYYYAYRFKGKLNFSRTDVSSYGYSGGGANVEFEHWL